MVSVLVVSIAGFDSLVSSVYFYKVISVKACMYPYFCGKKRVDGFNLFEYRMIFSSESDNCTSLPIEILSGLQQVHMLLFKNAFGKWKYSGLHRFAIQAVFPVSRMMMSRHSVPCIPMVVQ